MALVKKRLTSIFIKVTIVAVLFVVLAPILWMVISSFKSYDDIIASPPLFVFKPVLDNYIRVRNMPPLISGLQHSLIVAISAVSLGFLFGIPVAYSIARIPFRLANDLRVFVLSLRFMPPVAVAIPFFVIWLRLGMLDKIPTLIFTYLLITISSLIWLTTGIFRQLPIEFEEAAFIDGASEFTVFTRIALPIALPSLLGMAVFTFILVWNEFFLAFLITSVYAQTMPVAAAAFAVVGMEVPWGVICASICLLSIPPLLLCFFLTRSLREIFA